MAAGAARGRKIVIAFIAIILLMSLGILTLHASRFGTAKLEAGLIREVLEISLLYWVYRGSVLAKWILILLAGLAGALALRLAIDSGEWLILLIVLPYLLFAAALLWSKSVNQFLDRYHPTPPSPGMTDLEGPESPSESRPRESQESL